MSQARRADRFPKPLGEPSGDEPLSPISDVFDLGVINLESSTTEENEFIMPFNGYVQRVGVTWPAGANNSIGVNLTANMGLIDPEQYPAAADQVESLQTFFPQNYPNPEFVTDDDRYIPFRPLKFVPARAEVEAEILNGSATSSLDLQVRVTVTNFDPRILGGGALQQRPGGV